MKVLPVFALVFLLAGCTVNYSAGAPYSIANKKVCGPGSGVQSRFASAVFDFYNLSQKDISGISFSFYVYDGNGAPVGLGSNGISSSYERTIKSNAKCTVEVPLDSLLRGEIPSVLQVGTIFITRINYSDGSVWNNPFGLYVN